MRMDDTPSPAPFSPPLSMVLGADQNAVSALVGALSGLVNSHKSSSSQNPLFQVVDLNLGDGGVAATVVDAFRQEAGLATPIRVSGTETDGKALEQARALLRSRDALGLLGQQEASASPAAELRNRLECGGGADMVLYAHAAYPERLPGFKLPRMVQRLGDMAAPHGAVLTLHNHGPSDADDIRRHVLGLPAFSAAGLNCNTQHKIEQSFNEAKLYSFSVTMPNTVRLPANLRAVEAIFSGHESGLGGADATDAAAFRAVLEPLAGGRDALDARIRQMDVEERGDAVAYFHKRIGQAGGTDLPLTIGGGQVVMAFRSPVLAREAFTTINRLCQQMSPPAIVLPISREVMPDFDKQGAYHQWKERLAEHGIANPPRVCQSELDRAR